MVAEKNLEIKKLKDEIELQDKIGAHKKDDEQRWVCQDVCQWNLQFHFLFLFLRIQQLTENLLYKQAILEKVGAEKTSLVCKIEHLEVR